MEYRERQANNRKGDRLKEATPTYLQDAGILSGDGKGKKIFTTISTIIDELSREANSVFDFAKGKESKTNKIEQNRLRNPFWNNSGLPNYMHYMTTLPPPAKQAGLVNSEALKFVLLLGAIGFAVYKLMPEQNSIHKKVLAKKLNP